jgi:mRNA deadenylase 3'-5' endonuclease subunit Ccr4
MYLPPLTEENQHISSWEYRRDLIQQRIASVDADIVCIQEVSPLSFDTDFAFMNELGYDGKEMYKKGRFRPATFYKRSRFELVVPAIHKDRTLLTIFRPVYAPSNCTANNWYVLNCHLQAGKQASRRLRQMNEGIKAVITAARKLKGMHFLKWYIA